MFWAKARVLDDIGQKEKQNREKREKNNEKNEISIKREIGMESERNRQTRTKR
jgi:hypothetical protein